MKKYSNVNDIYEDMISPLDNPEFYSLIMADQRLNPPLNVKPNGKDEDAFSLCNTYNLGNSAENNNFTKLFRLSIQKYLENFNTYEKYISKYPGVSFQEYNKKINYLQQCSHCSNHEESMQAYNRQFEFMRKEVGTHYVLNPGWYYFESERLATDKIKKQIDNDNINHRLYLTVHADYRALMAEKILERCEKHNIPYCFKIFMSDKKKMINQQTDTMVIYLENDEQVLQYVNMINEILEENPELAQNTFKPSPHLGMINDYIGYGFEPKFTINGNRVSYSGFLKNIVSSQDQGHPSILDVSSFVMDKIFEKLSQYTGYYNFGGDLEEVCKKMGSKGRKIYYSLGSWDRYKRLSELANKKMNHEELTIDEIKDLKDGLNLYFMTSDVFKNMRYMIISEMAKLNPTILQQKMFKLDDQDAYNKGKEEALELYKLYQIEMKKQNK